MRSVIGTYNLQSLLSDRDEINDKVRVIIEAETSSWGVAVPAVEIKDVKLPQNMQRAMAAEAEVCDVYIFVCVYVLVFIDVYVHRLSGREKQRLSAQEERLRLLHNWQKQQIQYRIVQVHCN